MSADERIKELEDALVSQRMVNEKLTEKNIELEDRLESTMERLKKAIAHYPNGADGCSCLFDRNNKQIKCCSMHADIMEENRRLKEELPNKIPEWEYRPCEFGHTFCWAGTTTDEEPPRGVKCACGLVETDGKGGYVLVHG